MLQHFIHWLFPPTCILCQARSYTEYDLCTACKGDLPWLNAACVRCGVSLEEARTTSEVCGACLTSPPPYDAAMALCHYEAPLDKLITGLKFQRKLTYARLLSELFITQLREKWYQQRSFPEVIIPVPLHRKRLQERGYNQALLLAKPIGKELGIPVDYNSCIRAQETLAQSQVAANERKSNVENAFVIKSEFSAKHVAILDDVITTGSTVMEISKLLRKQGVETIDIWCIARTALMKN